MPSVANLITMQKPSLPESQSTFFYTKKIAGYIGYKHSNAYGQITRYYVLNFGEC